MNDLREIIYISTATAPLTEADIEALAGRAAARNAADFITGFLVYNGVNFVQFVEGPAEAVEALYDRLAADPRHSGLVKLRDRMIDARIFPDWSMGWRWLEHATDSDGLLSARWILQRLKRADDGDAAEILDGFRSLASA